MFVTSTEDVLHPCCHVFPDTDTILSCVEKLIGLPNVSLNLRKPHHLPFRHKKKVTQGTTLYDLATFEESRI